MCAPARVSIHNGTADSIPTFDHARSTKCDATKKLRNSSLNIIKSESRRLEIMVQGNPDQFIKIISQVSVEDIELQSMVLEQVFMQYYSP